MFIKKFLNEFKLTKQEIAESNKKIDKEFNKNKQEFKKQKLHILKENKKIENSVNKSFKKHNLD